MNIRITGYVQFEGTIEDFAKSEAGEKLQTYLNRVNPTLRSEPSIRMLPTPKEIQDLSDFAGDFMGSFTTGRSAIFNSEQLAISEALHGAPAIFQPGSPKVEYKGVLITQVTLKAGIAISVNADKYIAKISNSISTATGKQVGDIVDITVDSEGIWVDETLTKW